MGANYIGKQQNTTLLDVKEQEQTQKKGTKLDTGFARTEDQLQQAKKNAAAATAKPTFKKDKFNDSGTLTNAQNVPSTSRSNVTSAPFSQSMLRKTTGNNTGGKSQRLLKRNKDGNNKKTIAVPRLTKTGTVRKHNNNMAPRNKTLKNIFGF